MHPTLWLISTQAGLQRSYRPSQLEYDGVFEGAAIFDDWLVLDPPLINAQTRRWNGQLANPTMGRCLHEHWRDNFLYVDHSFDEYTSLPSPLVDAGLAGGRSPLADLLARPAALLRPHPRLATALPRLEAPLAAYGAMQAASAAKAVPAPRPGIVCFSRIEMWIRDAATYPAKPPAAIRAWADAAASSAAELRLLIEEYDGPFRPFGNKKCWIDPRRYLGNSFHGAPIDACLHANCWDGAHFAPCDGGNASGAAHALACAARGAVGEAARPEFFVGLHYRHRAKFEGSGPPGRGAKPFFGRAWDEFRCGPVRHAGVVRRALGLAPEPDLPSYCRNESHADESRADDGPSEDAVQAAARAAAAAVAAALANSTATVRAALAEGAARGVEVAAARDHARAAPRRDSGATYCGQRPGYRCRGHGSEKRCHPDASCN